MYAYQGKANETLIQWTTDIIVAAGLAAVGYEYGLFIDSILFDCFSVLYSDFG